MSRIQIIHQSVSRGIWPWAVGAFLFGLAVSILMPPLLLVLIVALGVWDFAKRSYRNPASRASATLLGLGVAAMVFLLLAVLGGISW